ncbi:MAG TPA: hypothetical protein VH134_05615 [Candidatus Dormibacteraeota bacterium]|jgi:hypothetical protein|nr:hypothetical protein [Candidatus Dormibacteraeota bacterium]
MTETAAPTELTARDALRHQLPDHPSAREAMYWVICLPEERIGISVYAYLKPTGEATQVVLAWDPELRTVLLDEIRDVPVRGADLDDFAVGRLHMRQPDPLLTWDIEYAGEEMQLDFRFRALHRAFSYWENPNGSPLAFTSHNRIEQCGTVEGTLRFRGRSVHFRTTAHHDHSWGMRDWQAMMHYKWIAAQSADAQLAVHATQVIWRGRVMVNGYVLRDGLLSPLVDARFDGTYESDLHPRTVELEVRDAAGRVTRARGERFGGTVFPFPGVELTETGCRFEIEGRPGVGLCEMLWPAGYRDHLASTWGHLGGR